ncbi:MAG: hypothetical protein AAF570_02635, partial [Bacteroidota bacterium]
MKFLTESQDKWLNVELTNPNASGPIKSVLYQGEENTLKVRITLNSDQKQAVKKATPVEETSAIDENPPGSLFYLNFGRSLQIGDFEKAAVSFSDNKWEAKFFDTGNYGAILCFCPDKSFQKLPGNPGEFVVTVDGIVPSGEPGNLQPTFTALMPNFSSTVQKKVTIKCPLSIETQASKPSPNVAASFPGSNVIYPSVPGSPIDNSLILELTNMGEAPLLKDGDSASNATITVTFPEGDSWGCLASHEKVDGIDPTVNGDVNHNWKTPGKDDSGEPIKFKFTPSDTNKVMLAAQGQDGASVQLNFGNIYSDNTLVPDNTYAAIQISGLPSYKDLFLYATIKKKLPEPGIVVFDRSPNTVEAGQSGKVKFWWTTYGADYVILNWTEGGQKIVKDSRNKEISLQETDYEVQPKYSTTFYFTAYKLDQSGGGTQIGESAERNVTVIQAGPKILGFDVVSNHELAVTYDGWAPWTPAWGAVVTGHTNNDLIPEGVTISWNVENTKTVSIKNMDSDEHTASGSKQMKSPHQTIRYELSAESEEEGGQPATQIIKFQEVTGQAIDFPVQQDGKVLSFPALTFFFDEGLTKYIGLFKDTDKYQLQTVTYDQTGALVQASYDIGDSSIYIKQVICKKDMTVIFIQETDPKTLAYWEWSDPQKITPITVSNTIMNYMVLSPDETW